MLDAALTCGKTCSILYPEDNSFTFARNENYLEKLIGVDLNLHVAIPNSLFNLSKLRKFSKKIFFHYVQEGDSVEYIWTYIHNLINGDVPPKIKIGKDCNIHETAIIGLHGNTYAITPEGTRLHLKEIGGVRIGDRVDVEAYSLVHRSCFGDTVIEDDAKVCVMCNVGHNTRIGKRTYLAPGVKLGGGTQVGSDCFLWQNVVTHSQVKICDMVMIGNNSYVHEDIDLPGIYVGSPAKFIKPFDPNVLKGEVQW